MSGVDDLIAFLRDQLDEDERVARACPDMAWLATDAGAGSVHIARWDPARVLAEVEAKRQLLDWVDAVAISAQVTWSFDAVQPIRLLALPYANRDGYREEWRP